MKKSTKTATASSTPSKRVGVTGEHPFAPIPAGCADFLSRVAHDLRSPLGVISEVIPTLRNDLADHLSDEHKVLLNLAQRSLLSLRLFVERMRLVADLELSRLQLARHPTTLGPIVQKGIDTVVACEPRRGVTVSFEPNSVTYVADVDAAKLTHAISELVSNAMRHARANVRVSVNNGGREVNIVVEDDGNGIAAEQREQLFRRFIERPSGTGLGIGLSLTHDLVHAHGGRLSLEKSSLPSRSGSSGAKFVVTLVT